ncbi:GntR family transcriptional regulator [Dyella sp.]|uniref:GntR family transcriptional regulator n=1 Tax=Dyella sp. TaxID=1869338 RepID=UPI002D77F52A|nr:GntR family transcriptional regulator [Dyella sp.]HET7329669.1 GntR family transcriptional regulator [Dyella sp.]
MDASLFAIQPAAAEPIYRQILGQLQRLIAGGQLAAGERLPSVREMAGFHAINPMTVSRAWNLAEAEGLLERQRGKGMVVAATPTASHDHEQRLALLEPQMDALVRQAQELELPVDAVLERLAALMGEDPLA